MIATKAKKENPRIYLRGFAVRNSEKESRALLFNQRHFFSVAEVTRCQLTEVDP